MGCWAQSPTSAPASTPSAIPTSATLESIVNAKRQALVPNIQSVSQTLAVLPATGSVDIRDSLSRRLEILKKVDLVLAQQVAAFQVQADLRLSRIQAEEELQQIRLGGEVAGLETSYLLLDKLKDDLAVEKERKATFAANVEARKTAYNDAKKASEQADTARRLAKDAVSTNTDSSAQGAIELRFEMARADRYSASETARLRDLELQNARVEQEVYETRVAIIQAKVDWLEDAALFTRKELDQQLQSILSLELALGVRREAAEAERANADARYRRAAERLDAAQEANPALREEVEARRRELVLKQRELALLTERQQHLTLRQKTWERRFEVVNGNALDDQVREWAASAVEARNSLNLQQGPQSSRIADLRKELRDLDERIAATPAEETLLLKYLREQQSQLRSLITLEEDNLASLEQTRRLQDKFIAESEIDRRILDFAEWAAEIRSAVSAIWNYELTSAEDNPVTVRKIVVALTLFILGLVFAKYITTRLERRILSRLKLESGVSAALQALSYYFLIIVASLWALSVANVPLTLFAFVGGALAIGIGFGSQNIINNFISGLILLIERPLQEGHTIDVGGIAGKVMRIGPRCTHIRTGTNVDVYIPNSKLLENNLINSTRADTTSRVEVDVGVAYGSPPRDVAKLMKKAAEEHGKVLKEPEPVVLFHGYGENALLFRLRFWINSTKADALIIQSDLRYMIDHYFEDAGVEIPFPQREMRLKAQEPIPIRLVTDVEPEREK